MVVIQPAKKGCTVVRTAAGEEGGVPTTHLGKYVYSPSTFIIYYKVDPANLASLKTDKAMFSYNRKGFFGHLSLQVGEEVVEVEADSEGYMVVKNKRGKKGAVPTKCLGKCQMSTCPELYIAHF